MELLFIPIGILFALVGAVCLFLIILGLPGVWIMLALAALIELIDGWYLQGDNPQTFDVMGLSGWWFIAICVAIAAVGEVIEFAAGALGAKQAGSSRRGMVGALIGGMLGAFLFALPIPVIGFFIGAIIGTFAGAMVGELSHERATMKGSIKPAIGATIGRVIGTVAKLGVAIAVWFALTAAVLWP